MAKKTIAELEAALKASEAKVLEAQKAADTYRSQYERARMQQSDLRNELRKLELANAHERGHHDRLIEEHKDLLRAYYRNLGHEWDEIERLVPAPGHDFRRDIGRRVDFGDETPGGLIGR